MRRLLASIMLLAGITFAGEIFVGVDPRIEVLGVVNLLASKEAPQSDDNVYVRDVRGKFGDFEEHPAVEDMGKLVASGITTDVIVDLMFYLDRNFKPVDLESFYAANGIPSHLRPQVEKFVRDLGDFAQKTDFSKFFADHDSLYHLLSEPLANVFRNQGIPKDIEEFFGDEAAGYKIVLAPLLSGAFLSSRQDSCIVVITPSRSEDDLPHFCFHFSPFVVRQKIAYYFARKVVDGAWENFKKSASLFVPIADAMRRQGIDDWRECLRWHIAYSALVEIHPKDLNSRLQMVSLSRSGFEYLFEIADLIDDQYIPHRDKYPRFEDFAPVIAGHLEEIAGIPPQDFADRLNARITAYISDIWREAEKHCAELHFPTLTMLMKLDLESFPKQAKRVLTCFLKNSDHQDEHYWIVKYQIGKVEYALGNIDSAEIIFKEYIDHQPKGELVAGAYWRLGLIAERREKFDLARDYYKKALEVDPEFLQAQESLNELNKLGK